MITVCSAVTLDTQQVEADAIDLTIALLVSSRKIPVNAAFDLLSGGADFDHFDDIQRAVGVDGNVAVIVKDTLGVLCFCRCCERTEDDNDKGKNGDFKKTFHERFVGKLQAHLWRGPIGHGLDLKEFLTFEFKDIGDGIAGKRLEQDVQIAHGPVIITSGHLDLVFNLYKIVV